MACQNKPYVIDESPRKVAYCTCCDSQKNPYCDGTHAKNGSGKMPIVVTVESEKKVAWCGCRQSKNLPYCDGTHSTL